MEIHVEREHKVVRVPPQAGEHGNALLMHPVQYPADHVDVRYLEHEVVQGRPAFRLRPDQRQRMMPGVDVSEGGDHPGSHRDGVAEVNLSVPR